MHNQGAERWQDAPKRGPAALRSLLSLSDAAVLEEGDEEGGDEEEGDEEEGDEEGEDVSSSVLSGKRAQAAKSLPICLESISQPLQSKASPPV